jgi:araC-type DNA-binding domain-containing proteins
MNEKEIQSFSLETLLTVNEPRPEDLYFDGCLIASRVKIMDTVNIDLFRYPTRLDAFAILFCSEGSISFTSGLRRHTLDAKMLFILLPGSILQVESIRPESSVYTVICEEEFIRRINIDIKLLSRLFLSVEKQPCLRLCEAEWAGITGSFAEIRSESLPRPGDVYSPEVLRSMIRTLAYKVCRIIGRHIESQPAPETSARSRNDEYFNQFMSELTKHYMQERSVGFYAGQLHLTPKYLTTIIRKTSGRTAAE